MIPKLLSSSANPEKLSLTVKGILVGIVPLILIFTNLQGSNITQGDMEQTIDGIIGAITAMGTTLAAILTAWGGIRKIVIALKKK